MTSFIRQDRSRRLLAISLAFDLLLYIFEAWMCFAHHLIPLFEIPPDWELFLPIGRVADFVKVGGLMFGPLAKPTGRPVSPWIRAPFRGVPMLSELFVKATFGHTRYSLLEVLRTIFV
jgi:hypothetical protein